MSDNVTNLSSHPKATGAHWGPEQVLREALADLKGDKEGIPKLIVIWLDDRDGNYHTNFQQCIGTGTQIIALLEVFKQTILRKMGY